MTRACRIAFTIGFEQCQSLVQALYPNMCIKSLHANFFNGSLGGVVSKGFEIIMKITQRFTCKPKVDAAPLTTIV